MKRVHPNGFCGGDLFFGHIVCAGIGMVEKARNCSECEECMARCPYSLPIPELIKENLQWVDSMLKAM